MNNREFFVQNVDAELPRFERAFQALPLDKLSWRPHERSKSAIELVTSMAFEATMCPVFLKTGVLDFAKAVPPKANTVGELWNVFKQSWEETKKIVATMSDADWDSPSKMMSGDKTEWETTKCWMTWGMLLDLIHHRGQLSVYLRPMGGKVPSIYGPSGDMNG